jgi:S-formylglutathione hydrolase
MSGQGLLRIASESKAHGGRQGVYTLDSAACGCEMTLAVFVPPQAKERLCPVVWYLSDLTCSPANVMEKGEYRRRAAELGLIVVCPDTSPRGDDVPDDPPNWLFGKGAGYYLDATQEPWARNYRMETHIVAELPGLVASHFAADMGRQGIFGHSMGGHGALALALKHPGRFRSCSAFAPIAAPSSAELSMHAYEQFLGPDRAAWRAHDAVSLIEDGHRFDAFLVDQGRADAYLDASLKPWLLETACKAAGIPLTLRTHIGYDHSYNFVSTFMDDHLDWHHQRLSA